MRRILLLLTILVLFVVAPNVSIGQIVPKEQPAGMVASLEFTDVLRTDRGSGMLGRQGYAGFYYRLSNRLTGIALGSYGENQLEQGGELNLITTKATVLFDIFQATESAGYKHEFSIFLIGAVGNSWTDFSDDGVGSIRAFLTSTGIGIAVPAGTGYAAAYVRLDQTTEYQQLIIGIGYTIPFLINP